MKPKRPAIYVAIGRRLHYAGGGARQALLFQLGRRLFSGVNMAGLTPCEKYQIKHQTISAHYANIS